MITDRMRDVIKSGGEWVSSLELESLASTIDGVAEVAAIGIQMKMGRATTVARCFARWRGRKRDQRQDCVGGAGGR